MEYRISFFLSLFVTLLLITGCRDNASSEELEAADFGDKEVADRIWGEALLEEHLDHQVLNGELIACEPGSERPYTGWVKVEISEYDRKRMGIGLTRVLKQYQAGKEDGIHVVWKENGERSQGLFRDGRGTGAMTTWHPNGQKAIERILQEGKPEGLETHWYENGQKAGELHHKNGKLVDAVTWHPGGEVCTLTNVQNGSGTFIRYHSNGTKAEQTSFKHGIREGISNIWHTNGQKKFEVHFKGGILDGPWTMWDETGQMRVLKHHKAGPQDGVYTYWDEKGQKREEGNYKSGSRDGIWKEWWENGTLTSEVTYKDGVVAED